MKISHTSRRKKSIITAIMVVLIACLVGAAFLYINERNKPKNVDLNPASNEQVESGQEAKDKTVESDDQKTSPGSDPSPSPQQNPGESKATVGVEITAASQTSDALQIRAIIQALDNAGSCTLVLADPDGKTITKTAGAQAASSYSTCKGFDINNSELSPGSWTVTLNYEGTSYKGSATQKVNIK